MNVIDLTHDQEPKDVPRSVQKKIERYIERDKWKKLAKMIKEGEMDLNSIVGK